MSSNLLKFSVEMNYLSLLRVKGLTRFLESRKNQSEASKSPGKLFLKKGKRVIVKTTCLQFLISGVLH